MRSPVGQRQISGWYAGMTRAFPALALRAVLRTFKIVPYNFVEPKGSNQILTNRQLKRGPTKAPF